MKLTFKTSAEIIDLEEIDFSKYTRISEVPEFQQYAAAHQWNRRRDFGYQWKTDVFDFISDIYSEWIEVSQKLDFPISQADLKTLDKSLWTAVQNALKNKKMPDDINLPKKDDLFLNKLPEDEKEMLLAAREWNRKRMARNRKGEKTQPA